MSNETGKEIYKEYVNRWIDAHDDDSRANINEEYLWCEEPIEEGELFNGFNVSDKGGVFVVRKHYDEFTRAPKTQMINGHKVIAPRYDEFDLDSTQVFILLPWADHGVEGIGRHHGQVAVKNIQKMGWFDNEKNALAYAKAHRESK